VAHYQVQPVHAVSHARRFARTLASPSFIGPASILLLAFLSSATSLGNGFVYDDQPIILGNPRVHTLARWWETFGQSYWPAGWGDTNYRPLTILSFAVQWALGDGSPAVFHAVNVAVYAASCIGVLAVARHALPASAAWIVAALFAVHPVHVEAVGNVVGQSELVVALCTTVAVAAYLRARAKLNAQRLRPRVVLLVAALYAVATFSKENGFLLPGLLLLAEATIVTLRLDPARRTLTARARELWPLYATCGAIATAYLALRYSVLGGLGDDPNTVVAMLNDDARLFTMLGVVPEWARLLLWPARLAADYSPPGIPVILAPARELIPGLLMIVCAVLITVVSWQRQRVAALGLIWFAVAIFPVSNVILRSGVILAERTLFLPSAGALIAVGAVIARLVDARWSLVARGWRLASASALAAVLTLGIVKSAVRQRIWRDADTFDGGIATDAPASYRAHHIHGMWLFKKGERLEGERHLRLAISMFPYDSRLHVDLADQYRRSGLCAPARRLYRRSLQLGGFADRAGVGLVACLLYDAEFAEARLEAQRGVDRKGAAEAQFRQLAAIADSALTATRTGAGPTLAGTKRPIPK
jgi:protein O-mannosyl-transferase